MGIIISGDTNLGLVRKNNEDSIFINKELNLYIIADGMGGHNGGEIASQMVVKLVPQFIKSNISTLKTEELLRNSIKFANQQIHQHAKGNPLLQGMGTTTVLLFIKDSHLFIANVGDSRAYLVNKGLLFQLSKDHSLVQEKINLGIYTRADGQKDKMKNVLVRAVGHEPNVDIDIFRYKINKNDIFLISSDGLHGKVSDHDIIFIINQTIPDLSTADQNQANTTIKKLIEQANKNGGQDNISTILVLAQ
ncbi:MAG: Stp1/IreP family PP2C-type Ser/Thr phosphatase [Oligoflexia bacterium]|nr:Stp1/IreP family PP2C-type Ser/Thr phosphatase [Oligoflexia bacterium]